MLRTADKRLLDPIFAPRVESGWEYRLDGHVPLRPIRRLKADGTGAAHPDRLQHVFADRVFGACVDMTPERIRHAAISLKLPSSFDGPLVATYKTVQDVLEDRAKVLRSDDNALRVPEFCVGRDAHAACIVVTVVDLVSGDLHSREFVATPQPNLVPVDTRHGDAFIHNQLPSVAAYFTYSRETGSLIKPAGRGSPPVGSLTDDMLSGSHLNLAVYGMDTKRDLDNCVLAVMDAIQATREDELGACTSIDRLVHRVSAASLLGRKGVRMCLTYDRT